MNDTERLQRWLQQAQAGDHDSKELLLGWLREQVKPCAKRRFGGRRAANLDASDVAQEVCLRVHGAFDRLYEGCTIPQLLGFARKILDNWINGRLRRDRNQVGGQVLLTSLAADTPDPLELTARDEQDERLEQAVQRLPEDQRMAFHLRFREGLTFLQVGQRMGLHLGKARVVFLRAVKRLLAELNGP